MSSVREPDSRALLALVRAETDVAASLRRLCSRWGRTANLPRTTVLARGRHTLSDAQIAAFGAGALRLSRNGTVRLMLDHLLDPLDDTGRTRWLECVHEALGTPFSVPRPERKSGPDEALQRWRLAFPDLAPVEPLLRHERVRSGDGRELFERRRRAGEIVRALVANDEPVSLSELGARLCGDSKALRGGALINAAADWLHVLDGGDPDVLLSSTGERRRSIRRRTLSRHGVVESGGSVLATVYGNLRYRKGGRWLEQVDTMARLGEAAVLSLANLHDIEAVEIPPATTLITCENESPFAGLVRGRPKAIVLYTRGFPNAAVCKLYRLTGGSPSCARRLHWGDSDPAGLRIAAILHGIHPLELWRCELETLHRHRDRLKPVHPDARKGARTLLENNPAFPFAEQLRFTLEHGWLEQEQWEERTEDGRHG